LANTPHPDQRDFNNLVELMTTLRGEGGCPWDREQTLESLPKYLIEESYELVDAVAGGDSDNIEEELGDLQFLLVFFAQIAREEGRFDIHSAITRTYYKMVRRHPHVFGDASAHTAEEVLGHWHGIKTRENTAEDGTPPSAIGNIPRHLPALFKAQKIQRNVARVGFDWGKAEQVLAKAEEELGELHEAIHQGDKEAMAEELGDLLFSIANFARFCDIESEEALEQTNRKFTRRFRQMEMQLTASGRPLAEHTLDEMDAEWERVKLSERREPAS